MPRYICRLCGKVLSERQVYTHFARVHRDVWLKLLSEWVRARARGESFAAVASAHGYIQVVKKEKNISVND